jgi:hypothetical protein
MLSGTTALTAIQLTTAIVRTLSAPATTKTPQMAPEVAQNRDLRDRAVRSSASPF